MAGRAHHACAKPSTRCSRRNLTLISTKPYTKVEEVAVDHQSTRDWRTGAASRWVAGASGLRFSLPSTTLESPVRSQVRGGLIRNMKRGRKRFAYEGPAADSALGSTTIYETIRAYKSLSGGNLPSSLYVNKVPVLTAIELQEEGVPVRLPYAWYKFGPEIEAPSSQLWYRTAPKQGEETEELVEDEFEYRTLVDWRGAAPAFDPGDRASTAIREKVRELLVRYMGDGKCELLVDRAYEFAPYEFQRKFRIVRIHLGRTGRGSQFQEMARVGDLWTQTHDAFQVFPKGDFPSLEVGAIVTQRIVNYSWNRLEKRDAYAAADTLEQFWAAFASRLRANPAGHSDAVPDWLVEEWDHLADLDTARFTRAAGDMAIRLSKTDPDVRRDDLLGEIAESREAERQTADREIDEALHDADELRAILSSGGDER
jgi:hypothetical protein